VRLLLPVFKELFFLLLPSFTNPFEALPSLRMSFSAFRTALLLSQAEVAPP